jgi:hypothetical protein
MKVSNPMNRLIKWLPALCITMVATACASPQAPNAATTAGGTGVKSVAETGALRNSNSSETLMNNDQNASENTGSVDSTSTADQTPPRDDTSTGGGAPLIDFYWVGRPECAVAPDNNLTIFGVGMRAGGGGEQGWPSLIPYRAVTDTGSSGSASIGSNEGNFPAIQIQLQESDYGRTLHVIVTADSNNSVRETDESNNTFPVTVQMPSGPAGNVPCSA